SSERWLSGVGIGSTVTIKADNRSVSVPVVGTSPASLPGTERIDAIMPGDDLTALAGPGEDTPAKGKAAPGGAPGASRDALQSLADAYPLVQVNSIADLSSELDKAISSLIALFGGLLGTAVVIALFGIANTISLSVVERTRESATIRALGLTRGQLRWTLLAEATLMGVVGAGVGVVYGALYGRMVVGKAFSEIGPTIVLPWTWMAGLLLLAAVAAMAAAVLPSRRAASASIVAAMA